MLYKLTVPQNSQNPFMMEIIKDYNLEGLIYDCEHGAVKRFITFVDPRQWQEHVQQNLPFGKERYNGSEDSDLLRNALYYFASEYNEEFLKGRFVNELETYISDFETFDLGAIWATYNALEHVLSRCVGSKKILTEKELTRLAKSVNATLLSMDYAIGFVCKLIKIVRRHAFNYPDSITNLDSFTIRKAYVVAAYTWLLMVKSYLDHVVLPLEYNTCPFFMACLPWNLHTFTMSYETMYPRQPDTAIDMLVKSPGRAPILNKPSDLIGTVDDLNRLTSDDNK